MKLHVLVGQIEAHAGGALNPLQHLTLKDWYYTKQPIFYTDQESGKLLWADTNDRKKYTLASIIHTVLDNTGEFLKNTKPPTTLAEADLTIKEDTDPHFWRGQL